MRENKQYSRTHLAIQSAFLKLLSTKPFQKITVQDILDTTPVSRATFYKHFRDKYEIAEGVQDEILRAWKNFHGELEQTEKANMAVLIGNFTARYRDVSRLILNIQADRVNLPLALARISQDHYLKTSVSPTREPEAKVYGAITSTIVLEMMKDSGQFSPEQISDVLRSVALRLIGLQDDRDANGLLQKRRQKDGTAGTGCI